MKQTNYNLYIGVYLYNLFKFLIVNKIPFIQPHTTQVKIHFIILSVNTVFQLLIRSLKIYFVELIRIDFDILYISCFP